MRARLVSLAQASGRLAWRESYDLCLVALFSALVGMLINLHTIKPVPYLLRSAHWHVIVGLARVPILALEARCAPCVRVIVSLLCLLAFSNVGARIGAPPEAASGMAVVTLSSLAVDLIAGSAMCCGACCGMRVGTRNTARAIYALGLLWFTLNSILALPALQHP